MFEFCNVCLNRYNLLIGNLLRPLLISKFCNIRSEWALKHFHFLLVDGGVFLLFLQNIFYGEFEFFYLFILLTVLCSLFPEHHILSWAWECSFLNEVIKQFLFCQDFLWSYSRNTLHLSLKLHSTRTRVQIIILYLFIRYIFPLILITQIFLWISSPFW